MHDTVKFIKFWSIIYRFKIISILSQEFDHSKPQGNLATQQYKTYLNIIIWFRGGFDLLRGSTGFPIKGEREGAKQGNLVTPGRATISYLST